MRLSFYSLLSIYLVSPFLQVNACTTDEDCDLNGVCTDSVCHCDPGWLGADCGRLDLRPGPVQNGYNLNQEGTSSWCNSIVKDPSKDSLYHLIVSEFTNQCGLDYWAPFSRIIRAESTNGPIGPYEFKQEIAPSFAHNPSVVWNEAEQLYVLYSIGCRTEVPASCKSKDYSCGPGNTINGESGISVRTSPNLRDWTSHGQVIQGANDGSWDADTTNPAPLHFPLGSSGHNPEVILAYRGCPYNCSGEELINVASASDPTSSYKRLHPQKPIFQEPSEDPFIWADKRGNYHMLVHSLLPDAGFGDGPNVGRHAFARSWNGKWTFNNATVAFNTTVHFTDGPSVNYYRRERPNIFFSDDGMMRPLFLSTGVQEVNSSKSHSLIQPIGNGQ